MGQKKQFWAGEAKRTFGFPLSAVAAKAGNTYPVGRISQQGIGCDVCHCRSGNTILTFYCLMDASRACLGRQSRDRWLALTERLLAVPSDCPSGACVTLLQSIVQSLSKKYFCFPKCNQVYVSPRPVPQRGVAHVTDAGGCDGRGTTQDERR